MPILVKHVTAGYRNHIKVIYVNSPVEQRRVNQICQELDQHAGAIEASKYGPRLLREQRDRWVNSGKSRTYCNRLTDTVPRMMAWAVSEELMEANTLIALRTLSPLREGQTTAHETDPVRPVATEVVRATATHLGPIVKAMVRIQLATGMRPSELFNLRPCDIDRGGTEWIYRPPNHKNKSEGKVRAIPLIGDAREALEDYLNRPTDNHCFSPKESYAWYQAVRRSNRKSKVPPSQRNRTNPDAKRKPGDKFTSFSYRRAIVRAAEQAGVELWFPYLLRHLNLTEVRDVLGAEHAQAMAGHSNVRMTEQYAKVSEAKAIEAVRHAPKL